MSAVGDTEQLEYSACELLSSLEVCEPLIAAGVRCHGGFAHDGTYVSPRSKFRLPAIGAWQRHHQAQFGSPIIEVPLELWGEHFPNVAQTRLLIHAGIPEPLIATLTRIGTLEGYGAKIALLRPDGLQRFFDEDIAGTAIDHLGRGLFEAHGRDEAGCDEQAGHRDMWFAARDIAFQSQATEVDVEAMLARMGFGPGARAASASERLMPDDIDFRLEFMVSLMIRVLFIEVAAFHTFAWAQAWLSDPDLVAGDGAAGRLVSYIRADESPHVGYLATALTELRDRTWIGDGGRRHNGVELIDGVWHRMLDHSLAVRREEGRRAVLGEVERWCLIRPNGAEVLAEFHSLAA